MLKSGTSFGAYTIIRELGRGGMGEVYEAEHAGLGKRVALKVMRRLDDAHDNAERRFLREGRAAARIRHENVVDVTDVGIHEGTAFLVMELLQGETLAGLLAREGVLDAGRIADVIVPVAGALAAAHERGVMHRDVKPENIFLARSRRGLVVPKVVDFGLSRVDALDAESERLTGSRSIMGTPAYLSPESVRGGGDALPASDQYALGVVIYECATGALPFKADSLFALLWAIVSSTYAPPAQVKPDVDPALAAVITRAMALEPSDRFPDMRALAEALLPFASGPVRDRWREEFAAKPASVTALAPVPSPLPVAVAPDRTPLSSSLRAVVRPRASRAWLVVASVAFLGVAGLVVTRPAHPARVAAPAVAPAPAPVEAPRGRRPRRRAGERAGRRGRCARGADPARADRPPTAAPTRAARGRIADPDPGAPAHAREQRMVFAHPLLTRGAVLVALAAALSTGVAHAQTAPASEALVLARAEFERGIALATQQRWAEALAAFERSRATVDRPNSAFNAALALQHLGRMVEARRVLEACLAMPDTAADEELARDARDALVTVRASVAALTVTLDPPGAELRVDGVVAAPSGPSRSLELDPTTHAINVSAPGFVPRDLAVTLGPGARESRSVTLAPSPARLLVTATPADASVSVDGVALGPGVTAWEGPPRSLAVRVFAAGYRPADRSVTLGPGERAQLAVTLTRAPRPVTSSPWLWAGIGAGVAVVAAAVVIAVVRVQADAEGGTAGRVLAGGP